MCIPLPSQNQLLYPGYSKKKRPRYKPGTIQLPSDIACRNLWFRVLGAIYTYWNVTPYSLVHVHWLWVGCLPSSFPGYRGCMFYHEDGAADSSETLLRVYQTTRGQTAADRSFISLLLVSPWTLRYGSDSMSLRPCYAGYVCTPPNPAARVSFRTDLMMLENSTKRRERLSREIAYPRWPDLRSDTNGSPISSGNCSTQFVDFPTHCLCRVDARYCFAKHNANTWLVTWFFTETQSLCFLVQSSSLMEALYCNWTLITGGPTDHRTSRSST